MRHLYFAHVCRVPERRERHNPSPSSASILHRKRVLHRHVYVTNFFECLAFIYKQITSKLIILCRQYRQRIAIRGDMQLMRDHIKLVNRSHTRPACGTTPPNNSLLASSVRAIQGTSPVLITIQHITSLKIPTSKAFSISSAEALKGSGQVPLFTPYSRTNLPERLSNEPFLSLIHI